MPVINALQSVLSILIMISIGYMLTGKGWLDQKIAGVFSRLVINVSLPSLMIYNLLTSFTKGELLQTVSGIIVPFTGILLSYLLSFPISRLLQVPRSRKGLFRALFTFSNTIFIGLPVNLALFGEKSVPLVTLYYIANTTLFWTIGLYGIKKDNPENRQDKLISLDTLKNIFSPILAAYITGFILVLLEVSLPNFIMETCKYMSQLTTPLSMLFIGIIIHSVDVDEIEFNREILGLLTGCFLITPLMVMLVFNLFDRSLLMEQVFIMEAAMPVMATIAIVSRAYGSDYKYATTVVALANILSLLVIPLYMLAMSLGWLI